MKRGVLHRFRGTITTIWPGSSNGSGFRSSGCSVRGRCAYALHLGLTEAGMGSKGIVASTAALAVLLQRGIGDTIRVSLTPQPDGDRTEEVIVAQQILQTMGLRSFMPLVTACPGLRPDHQHRLSAPRRRDPGLHPRPHARLEGDHEGVETMSVAVMGCIVNGPGESKHADIGISLPGTGEEPAAPVFIDGRKATTLRGPDLARDFRAIVETYVDTRYPRRQADPTVETEAATVVRV